MKEFVISLAAALVVLGMVAVEIANNPWLVAGAVLGAIVTAKPEVVQTHTSDLPSAAVSGASGVPDGQWDAMVSAGQAVPCKVRPEDLAAMAKVESGFGANMATNSTGHFGYGQFDAATWAAYGQGGNPYDYHDALAAMARTLCAKGYGANRDRGLNNYGGCLSANCLQLPGFLGTYAGYITQIANGLLPSIPSVQGQEDVPRIVQRWLGTPYQFGGCSFRGVDCSCFVQQVYASLGSSLPRTAADQFSATQRIGKDQLQVGDLVFFANTYMPGISHVGIYAGNGMQWNAPTDGQVVSLQPVFTGYWGAHFAGAGRVRR